MNKEKGIIYIRDNEWFKRENVIKIGVTSCAKNRSKTYITGEVERGEYIYGVEIPLNKMKILDKLLKKYFSKYNVYRGGGIEFYKRDIDYKILIEDYLKLTNIQYRVLDKEEIELFNITERLKEIPNIHKLKILFNKLCIKKNKKLIKPYEHQLEALNKIKDHFDNYDIGKINWACGLGKALLSIFIIDKLKHKLVLFGVPSNNLQIQIRNEIIKIFPNKNNILFVGGNEDNGDNATTNEKYILSFINNHNNYDPIFIITTYYSCNLLFNIGVEFDFKIGDEAHHLVGLNIEEDKGYRLFHKIKSKKSLFMTATEKIIEPLKSNKEIYTMDDENVFGKCIDKKSVHWAIENNKITDYYIVVLKNTELQVDQIIDSLGIEVDNKELFISCYMCLKSFEKYNNLTHLLLYTNTTEDAEITKKYIDKILSLKNIISISPDSIYNNVIHSKNCKNSMDLNNEISKFKEMEYGIISGVYIFGEGFDLPKLNGVCIVGNMQSEIRIVQYILRANRLESNNPNKKSFVIIPYIDYNKWNEEHSNSYNKVRNIISQMRIVDKNIEQKISVLRGKSIKSKKEEDNKDSIFVDFDKYNFEENQDELNNLKLRLRYSKTLKSDFTEEEDEYNYIKSINKKNNITSKNEYHQMKGKIPEYIKFPEEYFIKKGVWTDWYDFMGCDTSKFIKTKEEFVKFCKNLEIKSLDEYKLKCEEFEKLPKEPSEFYKNFSNIGFELDFDEYRR